MDCHRALSLIVDARRGRLPSPELEELRSHLSGCDACARADAAEGALDDLLERELPRRGASAGLLARLEHMVEMRPRTEESRGSPTERRWPRFLVPTLAACLAIALAGVLLERSGTRADQARAAFDSEAVSDHLRSLAGERGPEIASSANHEVKPWFQGRIDFSPAVPVPDAAELRLRGGSVGYFLDRRSAVVSYTLRRHAVTLLAFRPDGLALPEARGPDGRISVRTASSRGFRVASWRVGDVGYALVSDVAPAELNDLAAAFASATAPSP
jgi:anti-sigma factor RsiW